MLLWKNTLNIKIRSALLKNKTFNSFTKIISLWTCWKDQIGALGSKVEKLPTQLCKCRKREGLGWHNLRGASPPSSPRAKTFKRSQTPETMTGGQALKMNCPDLSSTSRMIPKMCSEDSWIIFFNEFLGTALRAVLRMWDKWPTITLSGILSRLKSLLILCMVADMHSVASFSSLVLPIQMLPTLFKLYLLPEAIFHYSGVSLIWTPVLLALWHTV